MVESVIEWERANAADSTRKRERAMNKECHCFGSPVDSCPIHGEQSEYVEIKAEVLEDAAKDLTEVERLFRDLAKRAGKHCAGDGRWGWR